MKTTEIHHKKFRSQGGTDDPDNLEALHFKSHAELHAWDFVNGGPWFDNRLRGAPILPLMLQDMVFLEQSRRTTERNLTMVENGTHPSFREEHRDRWGEMGREMCLENGTGSERDKKRLESLRETHKIERQCPHCLVTGTGTAMMRWHFDNCPEKTGQAHTQTKLTCPHCGLVGGVTNMKRYHFENCKHNETRS